jgi:hypothetical protein
MWTGAMPEGTRPIIGRPTPCQMPADCRWNCCWRRERCGESGTIDGHPVEMLGLIAIPARDANCPLEGADSTSGGQPQRSQILSRPKVLQSAKLG